MFHGMINEQGHCLDVRDDIAEKNIKNYVLCKSLVACA